MVNISGSDPSSARVGPVLTGGDDPEALGGICAVPVFAGLGGQPGGLENAETNPDSGARRQNIGLRADFPQKLIFWES